MVSSKRVHFIVLPQTNNVTSHVNVAELNVFIATLATSIPSRDSSNASSHSCGKSTVTRGAARRESRPWSPVLTGLQKTIFESFFFCRTSINTHTPRDSFSQLDRYLHALAQFATAGNRNFALANSSSILYH